MIKRTLSWKAKGSRNNMYDCAVKVMDKQKLIVWIDCTCWNFVNRRLKSVNENADKKVFAEPCKHLNPIVESLIKQGYNLKRPKEMIGSDKLTKSLWNQLLARAKNQCEECGYNYSLQVHRKTRGSNGGKYNEWNCVVLCAECHKARHAGESK